MAGEIPLRNIWLLFLYAADLVQYKNSFERDVEAARDLPDLVGRLIAHVVEQRLRRNLSRGYRTRAAVLPRVRGRIDMLATETGQLMERGQVACQFQEHVMDTPRNRMVRAALDRLAARISEPETAHRCRSLAADFSRVGVANKRPSRAELGLDQIGRNERTDRMMVALARMVFDDTIPTETMGSTFQPGTDASEHLIRRLFERAVGNALRLELEPQGWRIAQGRRIDWPVDVSTLGMPPILPGMQTDIELNNPATGRRIIIDTKFTRILTSSNFRGEILKSGYLYQIYAYLRTQERNSDPPSLTAEGILLHPQVGGAVDETMIVQGHQISVRTIDLTADASEFEASLRQLVRLANSTSLRNESVGGEIAQLLF
ncbi:5-methylcytosine-specific restriction endonuclease system specificity protein McrC [Roseibium algicola]|uniref:5-methylcytosine-specific restriction endonuclease system specificity protein McrC n=1 Tax=Roseibium algicola TaxID=2857014 RepID=A0ABN4WWB7_9HYPH|nr:5-methylcytosine-specific restriction endonuclease system specificity protein McrC [Roseibium aggregatum]AQQ04730.1 5-methylcytosine-specific restriction endonuclease system specificity protein McrC [Roseibium aggregatum]